MKRRNFLGSESHPEGSESGSETTQGRTQMKDIFRPCREPATTLYDVFQKEAAHRKGRSVEEWQRAERLAVWKAARDYAQQHGLRVPTMEDVEQAETCASGHVDYGAKWAYGIAESIR